MFTNLDVDSNTSCVETFAFTNQCFVNTWRFYKLGKFLCRIIVRFLQYAEHFVWDPQENFEIDHRMCITLFYSDILEYFGI